MSELHPLFSNLEPLLAALDGHEVRAVGGAVRAVLRRDPLQQVEVDLATTASPSEMQSAFLSAGLAVGVDGLRWGSLTVSLPGLAKSVDITTLRTDVYAPGSRYPTVHFVQDWLQDAERRDFTMNAVFLSPDGSLFDPFGGMTDLKHGVVKFIGDPAQRLREDSLRLLRFLRFCGHYGLGGLTPEVALALQNAAPALGSLSLHRVQAELGGLRASPQANTVLTEAQRLGLLAALN
jgi:poly(A) polymerase